MSFAKRSFFIFLSINLLAALHAPILDCDEVFNYWEPTHYLSHGYGFQTWEYSPEYAIRSWLYIAIHAFIGRSIALFTRGPYAKRHEFIGIRIALATISAFCQTRLFNAVAKHVETRVAVLMALVMTSSTGMFYASVAYLPSSFSMYTSMLGLAAFLKTKGKPETTKVIFWFGLGVVLGWPFSGALILPLLMDEFMYVLIKRDLVTSINRCIHGIVLILPFVILDLLVNAICFRRLAFSPWRIVSYNIFSGSSRGPDIFGTEPWHFYFRNLLLNFNVWFLLALGAGPVLAFQMLLKLRSCTQLSLFRSLVLTAPFYLWLAIFSIQPHKEERFMYPAYPLLTLNAAITLHVLLHYLGSASDRNIISRIPGIVKAALVTLILSALILVGGLRTLGTITAYGAPLQVYKPLQAHASPNHTSSICLGKEWYRFPSSYYLPSSMRAHFIKSEFQGLLPGQFAEEGGTYGLPPTWTVPIGMNDQNVEDPRKHTDIESCAYLVDTRFKDSTGSEIEPDFISDTNTWDKASCTAFLDTGKTRALARLFWVPDWPVIPLRYRRQWADYCLLQRKSDS